MCIYVCVRGWGGKQERAHLADPELAHNPVCHSSNINRLMQRRGVTDGGVAHSTVSRSQENSHFGRMFDSFFVLNSLQSAITGQKESMLSWLRSAVHFCLFICRTWCCCRVKYRPEKCTLPLDLTLLQSLSLS